MTQQEFFSRYTFNIRTDKIGGGGFGTVYKAYDNTFHRDVAVKVSEVKTAANGKTFSLKDEFEALSGLPAHPNIANYESLYSFEMPNGLFDYAVMQFYPDGNLSNLIKAGLDPAQKEDVALQLLEGVSFLHQHNVVHRDLKPGNILIVKHGGKVIPLITDFGLSKTADTTDRSMFSNSFGGGTARYSSPEQLQGQPLRLNTDLWSYGVIVYELFTGDPLFEAGSSAANSAQADLEIFNKIINGDTGGRLGSMPAKWRRVLERCLVVDPANRVKSAEELLTVLTAADVAVAEESAPEEADATSLHTDEPEPVAAQAEQDSGSDHVLDKKNASRATAKPEQEKPRVAGERNPRKADPQKPAPNSRKRLPWIVGGTVAAVLLAVAIILIVSHINSDNETAYEFPTDADTTAVAGEADALPVGNPAVSGIKDDLKDADDEKGKNVNQEPQITAIEINKDDPTTEMVVDLGTPAAQTNIPQQSKPSPVPEPKLSKPVVEEEAKEAPVRFAEVSAQFSGDWNSYLKNSISSRNVSVTSHGTVVVQFVVEKNGTVSDVRVLNSVCPDCDQAVVSAVKGSSGKWIPAKDRGKPVRFYYSARVSF